jgi:hypothetical protein
MSSIIPTIGRKVWYYEALPDAGCMNLQVPYDATVVYVWGPDLVNLRVTKHTGDTIVRTSVPLRDPSPGGDQHGTGNPFCTWNPNQMPKPSQQPPAPSPSPDSTVGGPPNP